MFATRRECTCRRHPFVTVDVCVRGAFGVALAFVPGGWVPEMTQPPLRGVNHAAGAAKGAGDGLLSRELSPGVPSALSGLTTVFGMGTGVALTL